MKVELNMKILSVDKHKLSVGRVITPLLLFLTLILSHNAFANLSAKVDRTKITIEDTLTLTLRLTDQSNRGEPDLSLLQSQFEVLNRHQSSQTQYSNGKVSSYVEWTLTLAPKRTGNLLIPSFNHMGFYSDAIEIEVAKAASLAAGQLRDIFVETLIEKDSVYVQEQVVVKYRLYYSKNVESLNASPLDIENTTIEELKDARYRRNVNGVTYNIAEFNYAIYPQISGELVIPAQSWQVQASNSNRPRNFFDRQRLEIKRLTTDEKRLTVKPIPAEFPADKVWLPASELTVAELWSKDPKDFDIGEPISRTLKISAQDLMASQLPETLANYQGNDFKSYTEQAELKNNPTSETMTSVRTENAAYVVSRPGTVSIPAVAIPWWDTDDNTLKYAKLPERVISIEGQTLPDTFADSNQSALPTSANTSSNLNETHHKEGSSRYAFWKASSISFMVLWLLTLGLWFFASRKKSSDEKAMPQNSKTVKTKEHFKQLERAAMQNDAKAIKGALVAWATLHFDKSTPISLEEIRQIGNDPGLNQLLTLLESCLYQQNSGSFEQGTELLSAIKAVLTPIEQASQEFDNLAPLYQTV